MGARTLRRRVHLERPTTPLDATAGLALTVPANETDQLLVSFNGR